MAWELAAPLVPCDHVGRSWPWGKLRPQPGSKGPNGSGWTFLACFPFSDFLFSQHWPPNPANGWVGLAVSEEILKEIGSIQIWQDSPTAFSRARQPPQNQPAGPRKLGLCPWSLSPSPKKGHQSCHRNRKPHEDWRMPIMVS